MKPVSDKRRWAKCCAINYRECIFDLPRDFWRNSFSENILGGTSRRRSPIPTAPPPAMTIFWEVFIFSRQLDICSLNASSSLGNARCPSQHDPVATMSTSYITFSLPSTTTKPPFDTRGSLFSSIDVTVPILSSPGKLPNTLSYDMKTELRGASSLDKTRSALGR